MKVMTDAALVHAEPVKRFVDESFLQKAVNLKGEEDGSKTSSVDFLSHVGLSLLLRLLTVSSVVIIFTVPFVGVTSTAMSDACGHKGRVNARCQACRLIGITDSSLSFFKLW